MHVPIVGWLLAGFTLAAAADTTNPPPTHPLSLRECIRLALVRNLDLQIQRLSTDIVRDNLSGAYGAYVPTLSVAAKHGYETNTSSVDFKKTNPYLPYDLQTDSVDTSVHGLLPFGLNYNFDVLAGQYQGTTALSDG